jgi:hypothetical protein
VSYESLPSRFFLGSAFLAVYKIRNAKKSVSKIESYREQYINNHQSDAGELFTEIIFDSPFSKSQNRWLDNQGFDRKTYNWDDLEINRELKQGIKFRNQGKGALITGVSIAGVYLYAVIVRTLSDDRSKTNIDPGPFFVAISVPLIWGMVTSSIANNKIRRAKYLRRIK